jgi:hypothetical protein
MNIKTIGAGASTTVRNGDTAASAAAPVRISANPPPVDHFDVGTAPSSMAALLSPGDRRGNQAETLRPTEVAGPHVGSHTPGGETANQAETLRPLDLVAGGFAPAADRANQAETLQPGDLAAVGLAAEESANQAETLRQATLAGGAAPTGDLVPSKRNDDAAPPFGDFGDLLRR